MGETDELFLNAGEKGDEHFDWFDLPRRRANKRRGRGTYANDRPPVLGVIGRESKRNFLRPFRGVHKRYLHGYVAVHEFSVNLKAISPAFIASLVHRHSF